MKNKLLLIISLFVLFSCSNRDKVKYDLSNPDIQTIIDLQDKRDTKALIPYFVNESKELRERACLAFASIQDSAALESLYTMLEEDENTAKAAALAVGQIGNLSSVTKLKKVLERSMNEETRFEFLVALGKCGNIEENYFLASNYNVGKDARGTAWALFYLARKEQINIAGIELAIKILQHEKETRTRLGAAQAILRNNLEKPSESILGILMDEKNNEVRMALAGSLSGLGEEKINQELITWMKSCSANCQINFLHSFNGINSDVLKKYAQEILLSDENINLQIEAATYLQDFPELVNVFMLENNVDALNWRVRALLLQSILSLENDAIYNLCLSLYEETDNLYEKGELLALIGVLPNKLDWLKEEISRFDSIVPTYGMNALASILEKDKNALMASQDFLVTSLSSKSPSLVTYSAFILRDSVFMSSEMITQLKEKRSLLPMPSFTEANIELTNTINFLSGVNEEAKGNEFNHPIVLDSLSYLNTIKGFKVVTTKGEIVMETKAWEAPGTVMTIARLVKEGYYDGKLYHRVVPNFVIQTGCPYGDGWGGLNFTIRSEFSQLRYTTGAVGMASAGKDTESCQWFVSHSPTPHLNGRYTIFAYVIKGMDVVQKIEVGDRIKSMEIVYN